MDTVRLDETIITTVYVVQRKAVHNYKTFFNNFEVVVDLV
jgi:hypothetical protein